MPNPAEVGVSPSPDWAYEAVEERLVEMVDLWRRSPGGGSAGYATDGPWRQMLREWWDHGAHDERPAPRLPLTRDEVGRRDEASSWVERWVPVRDVPLLWLALCAKARGAQPGWKRIGSDLGLALSRQALALRYERAVGAICRALNAAANG